MQRQFTYRKSEFVIIHKDSLVAILAGDRSAAKKKLDKGDYKVISTTEGDPVVGLISQTLVAEDPSPHELEAMAYLEASEKMYGWENPPATATAAEANHLDYEDSLNSCR